MSGDDDRLTLPQPPPPAPARREAAIDAALRRFDGGEAPARTPPVRPAGWWTRHRGQLGAPIAIGLIALVFGPTAWMTANRWSTIAEQPPVAERARHAESADALAKPEPVPTTPPSAPIEPARAPRPEAATVSPTESAVVADHAAIGADAPAAEEQEFAKAQSLEQRRAPMAPPPAAPPPPPAVVAAPAPVAVAPLGALPARRARETQAADNVVVTARKRGAPGLIRRGDWDACTINDPARSLSLCRAQIDPARKGVEGRADAQLADGLTSAWQGDLANAVVAFDRAIALSPRSAVGHLNRGMARRAQGAGDAALADFDRAITLAPHDARSYYQRSLLLRERGEARRAKADLDRAIEIDPGYGSLAD